MQEVSPVDQNPRRKLLRMDEHLVRTPLYDWHHRQGARLVDFAGWSMPVQYASIVEEHQATRRDCGLFDVSHMGRFLLEGPVLGWLDGLLTRRVDNLPQGRVRYALVTQDQGGVLDDILVYHLPRPGDRPATLLVVNASNRVKIWEWLLAHQATPCSGTLRDLTRETAMIAVQGPNAVTLATRVLGLADAPTLKPYGCAATTRDGRDWIYSRTGYTGEDGLELIVPAEQAELVWTQLLAAGGPGVRAAGLGARDTLRLEAAMPLYGHELGEEINAAQTGLDFALDLSGRNFVGRDAIASARQRSDLPVRVGLRLAGKRAAREGYAVTVAAQDPTDGNALAGVVTSGTFAPTLQSSIAMAYVPANWARPGTALEVDIRGRGEAAEVVSLPFYRRAN